MFLRDHVVYLLHQSDGHDDDNIPMQIITLRIPIQHEESMVIYTPTQEKRRKCVNKIIIFCAGLIFAACFSMVCLTLLNAKHIDNLGKFNHQTNVNNFIN